ncbi:MAG: hypothetical protein LW832_09375 [Parachlamydia sp.]|jgi:hypothetical protein|nr:hypothetical protein [Parachlamydia sp.]
MKEMPYLLFAFIQKYIKFFSNPEIQEANWTQAAADNEESCHDWIVNCLHSWHSIKGKLTTDMLLKDIDHLEDKLSAYLAKISNFKEKNARDLHLKILKDFEWISIQDHSKLIFKQARELLD